MSAETETVAPVYLCHNPACGLGSRKDPGRFTGGITAEALHIKTGEPLEVIIAEAKFGDGYCVECGEPGTPAEPNEVTGETGFHDFATGQNSDPYQDIHDQVDADLRGAVDAKLGDPSDSSVTDENYKDVLRGAMSQAQPMVDAQIAQLQPEPLPVAVVATDLDHVVTDAKVDLVDEEDA